MTRSRKAELTQESLRWPNAFRDVEASASLVGQRGWLNLLADLRQLHAELNYKIVHELKPTREGEAEQNFQRGQVAILERLLEFEEELKEWRESHKQ